MESLSTPEVPEDPFDDAYECANLGQWWWLSLMNICNLLVIQVSPLMSNYQFYCTSCIQFTALLCSILSHPILSWTLICVCHFKYIIFWPLKCLRFSLAAYGLEVYLKHLIFSTFCWLKMVLKMVQLLIFIILLT